MTTRQADKLIGKQIEVSFPAWKQQGELTIISRRFRSSTVEAKETATGHLGVFDCRDMELIRVLP